MHGIRIAAAALLNTLYPAVCINCHARIEEQKLWLCGSCYDKLNPLPEQHCPKCGIPNEADECDNCAVNGYVFTQAVSVFLYEGPAKSLVHALKYQGLHTVSGWFANRMFIAAQMEPEIMQADCLTAVPLHRVRHRERGYNQSELIAAQLAKKMSKPLLKKALTRRINTGTQTQLHAAARRTNLLDAFVSGKDDVSGKSVLLIDDVFTTGTTVNEAAKVLLKAGATKVYVMTACHGL